MLLISKDNFPFGASGTPTIRPGAKSESGTFEAIEAGARNSKAGPGATVAGRGAGTTLAPDVAPPSNLQDALAAFEKEARKTPAERARDQILAKHHLSEEGYAALSPSEKDEIDQEIAKRLKLLMKNDAGPDAGPADGPSNAAPA